MNGDEWLATYRAQVDQVMANETDKARLAHRLIQEVSVAADSRFVAEDRFDYGPPGIVPDNQQQLAIERIEEPVQVTKIQTEEQSADRAVVAVRRAALLLTQRHDRRVFRQELADRIDAANAAVPPDPDFQPIVDVVPVAGSVGEGMITAAADAIALLENEGYRTGYAMIVSNTVWTELHRLGRGSSTLPIAAVRDLIGDGPVHQTSVLQAGDSLLIATGDGRIDRVVAESPRLEFVDQNADLRNYSAYERFRPRFRETRSAVLLRVSADADAGGGDGDNV
jgi:hypothetical protein